MPRSDSLNSLSSSNETSHAANNPRSLLFPSRATCFSLSEQYESSSCCFVRSSMIFRRLFLASIRFSITVASSTVSLFLAVPELGPVQVVHAPFGQNPNNRRMNAPNLRWRPLFVSGIPILREIRDLNAETPKNLQIEN